MGMPGERAAAPAADDAAPAVQVRNAIALVVRRAWLVVLLGAVALVAGAGDGSRARAVTTSEVVDLVLNPDDVSGDDVLDLGANTFNAVAARVLPGSLPIEIPGLEDLGPVDMPQSTVTIIRPDAPLQVGGWIIKIEATPQLDMSVPPGSAPPKQLDVTIELEWEDADGDLSPTVSTQMSSSSPLSVAEALRFAGMLDAGAAPTDSIATDTVLTNLAVDAFYDGDGADARQSFDITATTTFGDDVEVAFLISWESVGGDERTISGLRVESPDPDADHVTLGKMFGGDWGFVANRLKFPEFVVARVDGLAAGETIGRADLRIGSIPLAFFAGCDTEACRSELPEDVKLDGDLAMIAEFDIASLDETLRDLFDPPDDDTTINLYGKIGGTFSTIDGDDPLTIKKVALRAEIPQSDGLNSLLPEWFETGAWTLRFDYDDDPLVGGITVSAETELRLDPDGDGVHDLVFDPVLATFTRTVDGTINMGLAATETTTWDAPFGLEWLDLTALELGGSILIPEGGDPIIDAALTSTFELCATPCDDPTVGNVEFRLAVIDEAQVQFRISFGDDGTSVPIGNVLGPIATEFGVSPALAADVAELVLDDLVFAVTVDTSGDVVFEAMASAYLPLLGDITAYLYVDYQGDDLRFFFGAKPSGGTTTLGQLLTAGNADADPPELLETIELPTLGIIATPLGDFTATQDQLTRDGFEFFADLHGCQTTPPSDPPTTPAPPCTFTVDLDPGVNLVANITFPGELSELAEMLWLDPSTGLQFRGTLNIPDLASGGTDVGLGLRLTLPRLDPGDAIEFIEDGALTIGISATLEDPQIKVFLRGDLNTRWRRGNVEYDPSVGCRYTSQPLPLYEDPANGDTTIQYCYDRLSFGIESALELSTGGLSVSLEGGLKSDAGWQHPFDAPGLDWLVVNDLLAKVSVTVPGPAGAPIGVDVGFLGDITIDNGDPSIPNTTLRASFSAGAGIRPLPNPPFVAITPNFTGVRAYVSRLGMADAVLLQEMIAGEESGFDLSTLPDLEFQDVELMFSIGSDPSLCLEPRFGIAGELWIDPLRDGAGGNPPDETDGCAPFGAGVDPVECIANRSQGCFASTKVTVGLDGIFASGSVGSFEFGPVSFDDALVDLRLKLGETPILAVSGGVTVDDLGSGRLAMKIAMTSLTEAELEFYGYLSAFGAFEAQVDGKATIGVDPLWVPTLDSDMALRVALRADFDEFLRTQVADELRRVADGLDDLDEALELLAQNPIANLAEARDALVAAGVDVPDWMNGLIDAVEAVSDLVPSDAPLPTYAQLVGDEPYVHVTDATPSCRWFDEYDEADERCIDWEGDRYLPSWTCGWFYELDAADRTCSIEIPMPPIGDFIGGVVPPDWDAALADLYDQVVAAITDIDLVPNISGLGIEDYLYGLADQLSDAQFLSVECAEFDWTAGKGAGEIEITLLLDVLGEPYGFQLPFDLTSFEAGARSVTEELLELFLDFGGETVECTGEQESPAWLTASTGLASVTPILEGGTATVSGTITPTPTTPIDITIEWGDGSSTLLTGVTGGTFSAPHTYPDDDPSGTPIDSYAVRASSPGTDGPAFTSVRVENVAPTVTILDVPDDGFVVADEGVAFTLRFEVGDVPADTHRAVIRWGDGATTRLPAVQSGTPVAVSHTYRDDHPRSGTRFDEFVSGISVTVVDDDNGSTTETVDLRIRNVDPVVTFPDAVVDGSGVATVTVQYSDPIGGDPATGSIDGFRVTATDVRTDTLVLGARFDDAVGTPGWLQFGAPTCVPSASGIHQTCTWSLSATADPATGIHTDIEPGVYELVLTVTDDDLGSDGVTVRLVVEPEDAIVWYQGPTFAATESARSGSAEIELRSTARDITSAVDPGHELWDPWPGDIRTARMSWAERLDGGGVGGSLCGGAVDVDAVFADFDVFDAATSVGVGTCDWPASISGDAQTWDLATVLSGRYERDSTDDDAVVTVAKPLDDFITGGGFLVLENSAGAYAGTDGSKANFGFHVKFNKSGTNLQGGATLIVRADGSVYRIKSNAMYSLGIGDDGSAQFEAKANLVDITDEDAPVEIGGGLLLQLRVLDVGEGAIGDDEVGFALWEEQKTGNGPHAVTTQRLLFSSNWDGQIAQRQAIGGGNVMVHYR